MVNKRRNFSQVYGCNLRFWQIHLIAILLILIGVALAPGLLHGQGQTRITLDQVQQLIRVGTPDSAIAGEIHRRGVDFVPSKDTLETLRRLGAGPQTIQAIDNPRPKPPSSSSGKGPTTVPGAASGISLHPQGYVNDFAGVLSSPATERLKALCTEVDRKASAQIAIVTVASLGGEPIEQFSIELASQWGVGSKQQARGVLILLATNDHKYRIEVGKGLEAILPDGKVGGFGREAVPLLQRSDFGDALWLMTHRVAAVIAEDQKLTLDTI